MTKRVIVIEIAGGDVGDYCVREGDRYCDRLCWDEMLGTIAELTHPKLGVSHYRMVTAEERADIERRREERERMLRGIRGA